MAITFTPEQQRVIDLHNCNILVSAAAGSGKTAVLAERIVKRVCDGEAPVDIDRLLVVTFTSAAAAEMRERIADGISKRLTENPESEHIQKQATLIHNAQITTIDSFCLYLLRNHFNEIGLDPAFRIADEGEVRLMQQEALAELMEDGYGSGDEAFRYCVEYFCPGGREKVLEQHILNLSRYAASFPFPGQWLEERKKDYSAATVEEICDSDYGRYLLEYLHSAVGGCAEKLGRVKNLCEEPDGPYMYGELVEGELEQLQGLLGCRSLTDYEVKLKAVSFGRLSSRKDDSVSAVKRELARNLRAQVKDSVQGLAERFFATPLELAARQAYLCREPAATLIGLALDFDRRMQEKKRDKKVIDFSDMEHFALDILIDQSSGEIRPSRVALEYRQHFVEILTDEYQDSNLVQEYLLRAVSGEEDGHFNRFMVGDVKQSIYKFRLARPELFLEKYNTYQPGRGDCQRIDLSKNFRSRKQVVDAVNDVFSRLMSEGTGGIAYDERAALYPGASYPENGDCGSELILIEKPEKDSGLGEKQAEALAVAARIRELRAGFQVTDRESGLLRQARYSDMVILLRSNSGWDEEFKEVLEGEGIPVYITSRTGYFGASEVQELLQLLRVLDNPTQDIPLFGMMKSLFGGFSEEEIALIRSGWKDCSLYEAVTRCAGGSRTEENGRGLQEGSVRSEEAGAEAAGSEAREGSVRSEEIGAEAAGGEPQERDAGADECGGNGALRRKCAAFIEMIKRYRAMAVYLPIRDLLAKLVDDFDYLNYVTALPAGGRRRANVEMLFTKASDFEKTSYFGLFHFVRYIEQLERYDVDYGEADTLDENADVVRIMSIHKSKGLEFPITFVSGLSKRFNMQDANQVLILDMDLGLGIDYVEPVRRVRNKTLRRMTLAAKLKKDSLSEELRVLYVALTRAREKLIMTATLQEAAQKWELCRQTGSVPLGFLDFVEGGSYLDFLLPALPDTSVEVKIVEAEGLAAAELQEQLGLADRRNNLRYADRLGDAAAGKKLQERLEAVYPLAGLAGLYTKTTVSELKIAAMAGKDEAAFHAFEEKEVLPYIPAFRREEETVSGAARGNAYHRVMELVDFERMFGEAWKLPDRRLAAGKAMAGEAVFPRDLREFQDGLDREALAAALHGFLQEEAACGRLEQEYLAAVREQKILHFLKSELGFRMWRAQREGRLYREQPFVLGIDAKRLGGEFPDRETVLIQGIIDVFFVEEDGMVLLDYKTDSVHSMKELWNRYETQLDYYEEALVKLMGQPVKERILYSFHLEEY